MTDGLDRDSRGGAFSRFTRRGFSVVEFAHGDLREYYLSFFPEAIDGSGESLGDLYERVAEFLSRLGAEIVSERCYGETTDYEEVSAVRAERYGRHCIDHAGSLSYIGGTPVNDGRLAGIQLWAVSAQDRPAVRNLLTDDQAVGRRFSHAGISYASIASVDPRAVDGSLKEHARSMFDQAGRILESYGLGFRNVARTWIYLPQLLCWYDDFNRARQEVFAAAGLCGGAVPIWYPASTGIQGYSPKGHECMMDLLAVSARPASPLRLEMLESPLQCEAYDYGSLFSRAVELRDESTSRIYVSGTASIDKAGQTVFRDDPAAQIRFTLRVVRELVGTRGHGLEDIAHCVAFLKRPEFAPVFHEVAAEEGLDARIAVQTVADVCRDDLLFELEAMTLKAVSSD
jgi:enamine deaminase RidA (YjgF/YER057c/UK114 family)